MDHCQICSNSKEARVDLLEMKTSEEIDLDENPILVLGCGHLFTAESLDGLIGMTEVYEQDMNRTFTGLLNIAYSLALSVPRCPDCQCPIRHHSTQRFNQVIYRVVVNKMSKRFLVEGKAKLQNFENDITNLEVDFQYSEGELFELLRGASGETMTHTLLDRTPAEISTVSKKLKDRFDEARKLERRLRLFCDSVKDENQPALKLHDATISAARQKSVDQMMIEMNINSFVPNNARDRRIIFGGRIAGIQLECIVLTDRFSTTLPLKSATPATTSFKIPGGVPEQVAKNFFKTCQTFIDECTEEDLPKLAVEACLYYAKVARSMGTYCRQTELGSC